jgi:hypothetical protein
MVLVIALSQISAGWAPRPAATWRSSALAQVFSSPPANHWP